MKQMLLLNLSLLLPAFAVTIKISGNKNLLPLLICFYFGLITTLFFYFLKTPAQKNIAANCYIFLEYGLLLWQLHKWGIPAKRQMLLVFLCTGFIFWGYSSLCIFDFGERNTVFRIVYSFILVLLSIEIINKLAFERHSLIRDHRFLIALALIFFYTYNIIIETFCISVSLFSAQFLKSVFSIKTYLNFSINILYFIALLCIPTKKKFSILS